MPRPAAWASESSPVDSLRLRMEGGQSAGDRLRGRSEDWFRSRGTATSERSMDGVRDTAPLLHNPYISGRSCREELGRAGQRRTTREWHVTGRIRCLSCIRRDQVNSVVGTEFSWQGSAVRLRTLHLERLTGLLSRNPVVGVLGARQVMVGASWEGFALQEVTRRMRVRHGEGFFWRTHTGAELDYLIVRGRKRFGFEFKRTDAPVVTPSIRSALADLHLDRLDIVHAGKRTYPLATRIRAVALERLLEDLAPLGS